VDEVGEIIATISIFGAAQIGLLLVVLGQMSSTQKEHGRRLDIAEGEIKKHADEIGVLKGEIRA
jgi:hypothetical protein